MTRRALVAFFALFLFSCATGGGGGAEDGNTGPSLIAMGGRVSSVEISLHDVITSDQRSVIEQYTAIERLQSDIRMALSERSAYSQDGELKLHVTIDGFRLRSNGAVI